MDVVLVNGILHEGDQIIVCGMQVKSPLTELLSFLFGISLSLLYLLNFFLYTGTYNYHHKSSVDPSSNEGTQSKGNCKAQFIIF